MIDASFLLPEEEPPEDPKRNLAVALRYEKERRTPVVVAKGSGLIAEEILRRAKESGVFVHSSRELIDLLMKVDVDARIPPSLYVAVAEVLAWVYRQDEALAQRAGLPRAEELRRRGDPERPPR